MKTFVLHPRRSVSAGAERQTDLPQTRPGGSMIGKWPAVRNMIIRGFAVILTASLLLTNCGQASFPNDSPGREPVSELTLTKADNGKSVEVARGDTVTITLEDNPSTGYRWAIDKNDASILAPQSDDYMQSPSSGIGGAGQRTFKFKALKAGAVQLQLKRWREWEGDSSIVDRFSAAVRVR